MKTLQNFLENYYISNLKDLDAVLEAEEAGDGADTQDTADKNDKNDEVDHEEVNDIKEDSPKNYFFNNYYCTNSNKRNKKDSRSYE